LETSELLKSKGIELGTASLLAAGLYGIAGWALPEAVHIGIILASEIVKKEERKQKAGKTKSKHKSRRAKR